MLTKPKEMATKNAWMQFGTAVAVFSCISISPFPTLASHAIAKIFGTAFISVSFAENYDTSVRLEAQSSYTRLFLSLDESFKPVYSETKDGFELTIPTATLMDVGVPFGGEDAFKKYLQTLTDSRIGKIEALEKESGLVFRGKFKFPNGTQALAAPKMEHFDFRQTEQGKYAIDFWYKKGLTLSESARQQKLAEIKKIQSQKENLVKKESAREQERAFRVQEAKNALNFCEQPFDRTNTVFLKYHAAHPILNFTSFFPEHLPDHSFQYQEPKGNSEEDQMIRLALKLSRENNYALSVKTIEFLEKAYPKSKLIDEMLFLKANAYYHLEFEPKGKQIIEDIAKRSRGTDVGLQCSAFLAVQAFQSRQWLQALDSFSTIEREFPKHPLNWLFRYGSAECLYQIRQSDRAVEEFEWVSKNAPKLLVKAEAAFKIGDVYFDRSQYAKAIDEYTHQIKLFEANIVQYPQVIMNLAESYFQLEEYKRAEATFTRYLEVGSNQADAWRASLRMAELKALNVKSNDETEKAFTETVNRFPMTSGAIIARLRLLPCGNHGGFDLSGMERFMASPEVKNFGSDQSLYSSSYKELVGLTEVRSYISFGQDQKAVDAGIVHLREDPTVEVRKLIEISMIGGIKRIIAKELEKGDIYAAIAAYEKYGDYLPLPTHDPVADDLRMSLAKFAAEKNFKTLALKLIEPYRQVNEIDQRAVVSAIEKSLTLESNAEQEERVYLEARTQWNGDTLKAGDEKQAGIFLANLSTVRDTSPYAFERDLLRGLYFAQSKDYKKSSAIGALLTTKLQKLNHMQKAQIWFWSAEMAENNEDFALAAKEYREARILKQVMAKEAVKTAAQMKAVTDKKLPELNFRGLESVPSIASLYSTEGEMLERDQKWKEAVALYADAVENKVGGNRILYSQAKAILKEGGRNSKASASRSLEKIKQSQDDDVWKKLAQQALDEIAKEGEISDKYRSKN